jgi:hypothetical protein
MIQESAVFAAAKILIAPGRLGHACRWQHAHLLVRVSA